MHSILTLQWIWSHWDRQLNHQTILESLLLPLTVGQSQRTEDNRNIFRQELGINTWCSYLNNNVIFLQKRNTDFQTLINHKSSLQFADNKTYKSTLLCILPSIQRRSSEHWEAMPIEHCPDPSFWYDHIYWWLLLDYKEPKTPLTLTENLTRSSRSNHQKRICIQAR